MMKSHFRKLIEMKEGTKFPSLTYKKVILEPAYNGAKENFVDYMMQINIAHLMMLEEQGLVTQLEAQKIGKAITEIDKEFYKKSSYDGTYEDLFFRIEHELIEKAGDIAGNLHIARSRNDMGIAIYRMTIRKKLLMMMERLLTFQRVLHFLANEHLDTIMIGYTHTQQAQPTTFAHYVKGLMDQLERDTKRLQAAFETVNRSSMGAAALTTSGFEVNRDRMCALLAFDDVIENAWDSVASADYLMEVATAIQVASLNLGRSIQDFLTWVTHEYNAIQIADPYVQVSSIMPQKRNPVALEHSRALLSAIVGDTNTVLTMIHNTPFGDINDTEDDLQPYLWQSIDKLADIYELLTAVFATMKVNKVVLEKRARDSFANVTELADTLVRVEKLSFRQAHHLVSTSIQKITPDQKLSDLTYEILQEEFIRLVKRPLKLSRKQFEEAVCPRNFIQVRKIKGGPAPGTMIASLNAFEGRFEKTKHWIKCKQEKIEEQEGYLDSYCENWLE
ncbi:argininosuccinate lyase [Sporosarcina ureilytica]|uniref:Argininosuccinate lyase n=1 Tax=Sporosarcina ureilytica TaxID=298596 RepID=A0A1D8JIX3_9BACL|nr:argininosuccinate lyase [Sporosarcina ureilytica]AOV08663.1 argininosuccinate lyase [Sporosarcina ureilytica]